MLITGFPRFSEIAIKPGQIFYKMTWARGTKKCPRFITPRTRIQNVYLCLYVCMYVCMHLYEVQDEIRLRHLK